MDAVREWAERHLLARAVFIGSEGPDPLPRSLDRARIDADREARFELAAGVFVELGVLSVADVAPLRRRLSEELARGVPGPPLAVDEGLAQRARALLRTRLRDVVAADRGEPAAAEAVYRRAVARFARVWEACRMVSALGAEELDAQWRRLAELDGGRTPSLSRRRLLSPCRLTDLAGVVPGDPSSGGQLRVLAAELYADGVVVSWHWHGSDLPVGEAFLGGRLRPGSEPALRDDRGREHHHVSTPLTAHPTRTWIAGRSTFAGELSAPATQLVFAVGGEDVAVGLPASGGAS